MILKKESETITEEKHFEPKTVVWRQEDRRCLMTSLHYQTNPGDFSGGTVVKNPPANAGDKGSSPGLGRSHMPWSN